MAAIASLSVNLVADLKGWSGNLKKASEDAKAFGGRVAGVTASAGKGFSSFAKGATQAAAGLALFETAKSGLSAAVDATIGSVVAGIDRIDQLTDAAGRIGVTTEALSSLRHAANMTGSSAEDLDAALEKLNANLGDAGIKANPASEAIKKIGLDAAELANTTPDDAFREIVHAFERVPNAADKASLAMDIFGKGGAKLINTLGAGNGTIDELVEEAKRLGVSVSQVDAARIGAAKDAMDRVNASIEGVGNSLAIALAPMIEVAADQFTSFASTAIEGAGGVEGAVAGVAGTMGQVADAAMTVEQFVESSFAGIIGAAGELLDALGIDAGKALMDTARTMREDIERNFAVKPSEKLGKFLDEVKAKSDEAAKSAAKVATANLGVASSPMMSGLGKEIEDLTDKLKQQADMLGKTSAEAEIYKLAMKGATTEQLAMAHAQADRLKAGELAQDSRSAKAKYLESSAKIDDLLGKGLISSDVATKSKGRAAREAGLDDTHKFAGAVTLGSSEGYSAIVAALSGRGSGNSSQKLQENTKSTADGIKQLVALTNRQLSAANKPAQLVNI
jgi:hypothetical protein